MADESVPEPVARPRRVVAPAPAVEDVVAVRERQSHEASIAVSASTLHSDDKNRVATTHADDNDEDGAMSDEAVEDTSAIGMHMHVVSLYFRKYHDCH